MSIELLKKMTGEEDTQLLMLLQTGLQILSYQRLTAHL